MIWELSASLRVSSTGLRSLQDERHITATLDTASTFNLPNDGHAYQRPVARLRTRSRLGALLSGDVLSPDVPRVKLYGSLLRQQYTEEAKS